MILVRELVYFTIAQRRTLNFLWYLGKCISSKKDLPNFPQLGTIEVNMIRDSDPKKVLNKLLFQNLFIEGIHLRIRIK